MLFSAENLSFNDFIDRPVGSLKTRIGLVQGVRRSPAVVTLYRFSVGGV